MWAAILVNDSHRRNMLKFGLLQMQVQPPNNNVETAEDLMHMDSPASNCKKDAPQASVLSGSGDSDVELKQGPCTCSMMKVCYAVRLQLFQLSLSHYL